MEDEKYVVRVSPLREMVHNVCSDVRVGADALEAMQGQIEQLVTILIVQSKNYAVENGRKTIKPDDVINAFTRLVKPHVVIDEAIGKLRDSIEELEKAKKQGFSKYLGVE